MIEARSEALVRRLERHAKEQPAVYQAQVGLLAALGYVYIFGIVLLLLGLVGALVGGIVVMCLWVGSHPGAGAGMLGLLKLIIPLGLGLMALIGVVFRAFQVHFEVPEGAALERPLAQLSTALIFSR